MRSSQCGVEMQTDDFEWDNDKAKNNLEKHGVSFEDATFIFDDPHELITQDGREHSEDRWKSIGCDAGGNVLSVVHAERGYRIRIISARHAETHEVAAYHDQ